MKNLKDKSILTKKDIGFAKSVDDDFDIECFQVDGNELFYLNGYDYPISIRLLDDMQYE